jgi:hypothetical protein
MAPRQFILRGDQSEDVLSLIVREEGVAQNISTHVARAGSKRNYVCSEYSKVK